MQPVNYLPVLISAFGTIITLAINLAIFAYFMGRIKGSMDAMERRLVAVETGNVGGAASVAAASAAATMVEKVNYIEHAVNALPELQAAMIRLTAQFDASQRHSQERAESLQSDYHALLVAVTQKAAPPPRSARPTKQ